MFLKADDGQVSEKKFQHMISLFYGIIVTWLVDVLE